MVAHVEGAIKRALEAYALWAKQAVGRGSFVGDEPLQTLVTLPSNIRSDNHDAVSRRDQRKQLQEHGCTVTHDDLIIENVDGRPKNNLCEVVEQPTPVSTLVLDVHGLPDGILAFSDPSIWGIHADWDNAQDPGGVRIVHHKDVV
eukprot:1257548-Amphidinium_carterae.1